MPNRCFLENARYPDGIDNALCMTESTLDDEVDLRLGDYDTRVNFSVTLMNDFTVAFWAMAREKLASSEVATTAINGFMEGSASGGLFFPLKIASIDSSRLGIGFFLGTDGFTVFQHSSGTRAPIVVQRQSLIGWHHYSIVAAKRELFVYVDGISEPIAQSANPNAALLGFRLAFGRTRFYYSIGSPTGFEGWISELRLANRSMHGSEAMKQINNQSAWDFSYSMKGCSGENHAGTEIDRFKLQQAWLVCRNETTTMRKSSSNTNGPMATNTAISLTTTTSIATRSNSTLSVLETTTSHSSTVTSIDIDCSSWSTCTNCRDHSSQITSTPCRWCLSNVNHATGKCIESTNCGSEWTIVSSGDACPPQTDFNSVDTEASSYLWIIGIIIAAVVVITIIIVIIGC
jgi:hypothetical protein